MLVGQMPRKVFNNNAFLSEAKLPNLVDHQTEAYRRLVDEGLGKIFKEFSPFSDYSGEKFDLVFKSLKIEPNKTDEFSARTQKVSYEDTIKATYELVNKKTGYKKNQEFFMFHLPVITDHGTFVVNGVERVVVPQLSRSFGIFFTVDETKKTRQFGAKVIPNRGSWIEFLSEGEDLLYVKVDRKRKLPIISFLRILAGHDDDDKIFAQFSDEARVYLEATLKKEIALSLEESYIELYKRLRDGESVAINYARDFINSLFTRERYDLSEIGRIRFNERFGKKFKEGEETNHTINFEDVVLILEHIIKLNADPESQPDDIDHLGSKRLRFFDEQIEARIRTGFLQMKRNIQDRMSIADSKTNDPGFFVNTRPIQAKIKEFFNTNPLAQFVDQENILYELETLRKVSALGPGGLVRERAGFEVRDVHPSHYGRLCPIHTPEGQNIGLILNLSAHSRVNKYGIIETPYYVVDKGKVTKKIEYIDAYKEETAHVAPASTRVDKNGSIVEKIVEVRRKGEPTLVERSGIDYIDVSPFQTFSVATSMVPFVNHDEANRALMGSNMQKQAVPCIQPEAPIVATGMEAEAARYTGRLIYADEAGEVVYVDGQKIEVKENNVTKKKTYNLVNFERTNTFTVSHQRPVVSVGQKVKKGQLLADASSSDHGQVAVGQNILVAFMSFHGDNYEDAIVVSERVAKEHRFTNVHIKEHVVDVIESKLGPEQTTNDIPNVSETRIKDLDEDGIIRLGAEVEKGDILVGKITPKGESQLTPEERLLKSIFGEKAKNVKDTSLRLKSGEKGRVVGIKIFDRVKGEINEKGLIKRIYVQVAELRNIKVGDKLAGRHGNKGVVSVILPEEDMPYTEDGRPIDIILSPLGVPSRMNLGQILETHLGLAAGELGYQAVVPPFIGATEDDIEKELKTAGLPVSGKLKLINGQTGDYFARDVTVGYMYVLKLKHMVDDKVHVRSVGPYSLINQQPLGGKAQEGGQRFGEMEVWALLGHGVAYTLREILTVKSDDIIGRSAMYDAIIKNKNFILPNTPESFNVMVNSLRGLCLNVEFGKEN